MKIMTQSFVNRFVGSSRYAVLALTATSVLLPMLIASQVHAGETPAQKPSSQPTPRTLRPGQSGATTVKAVRTEGVEIKPRRRKATPTVAKTTTVKRTKARVVATDTLVIRAPRKQTVPAPVISRTKSSRVYAVNTATGKRTATPPVRRSTKTLVNTVKNPVAPVVQVYPPYRKTVPPGSYVTKPARTDDAVYRQAITRPAILQRYQYAWKTSPEETLQRLHGLKLTRLAQPGVYRVYYTRANGAWGYKVRSVPAGTWVYALPETSRPIMLQVCGNPVEIVPPALAANRPKPLPFSPLEPDTDLILDGMPATDLASVVSAQPGLPSVLGELSTPSAFAGTVGSVAPGLLGGGISSGLGFALPVGVLGVTALNNIRPRLPIGGQVIGGQVINNVGPNVVTPVPEPSGFVFAGTLLSTLGAALGRPLLAKRKRRQNA